MPGKLEDLCYLAHHVKRASLMADIKLSLGLNYQPTPILLYFGGHYMQVEIYFFKTKNVLSTTYRIQGYTYNFF